MNKKKIGFLLGSPAISGGTNVIYEHGVLLQERGYHVFMITQTPVTADEYSWHANAGKLSWLTMENAADVIFDLLIATWWQSPFLLSELSATHYAYFVQSIESRFFEQPDPTHHDKYNLDIWSQYCESSYSLNIPVITEATWIQKYLHHQFNHSSFLVRNGIRKDLYTLDGVVVTSRQQGKVRVLVEGPVDVPYKNVPATIRICLDAGVDEIWLLTSSNVSEYPGVDRVFSRVPIFETPAIYRSCDVLVKLSYVEGMFGPPLEMFHCGGTAIVYDVTGHDEYIVHDENSYVVEKDNEEQVAVFLRGLVENQDDLIRLKKGGLKTAEQWPDWQQAGEQFNAAVGGIMLQPSPDQQYLQRWAARCSHHNTDRLATRELELFQGRERTGEAIDNYVQLYYWCEQEGLDASNIKWAHYKSGEKIELKLEVPLIGFPFRLRLDPSVRMGIIELCSICVRDRKTGELLLNICSADQFDQVQSAGSIRRIDSVSKALFLSFGDDPQLILPAILTGEIGGMLDVLLTLRETGVHSCLNNMMIKNTTEGLSGKVIVQKMLDKAGKFLGR